MQQIACQNFRLIGNLQNCIFIETNVFQIFTLKNEFSHCEDDHKSSFQHNLSDVNIMLDGFLLNI